LLASRVVHAPALSLQCHAAGPAAHIGAAPGSTQPLLLPTENSCVTGAPGTRWLCGQIVHGSAFSAVRPSIPSFCTGICHFTAARSSTSCSLFPGGTWLQNILSVLFSTEERALFSHPAAHKRGNQEAGQEFF